MITLDDGTLIFGQPVHRLVPVADVRIGKTFITAATEAVGTVLKKFPEKHGNARCEEVLVSLLYPKVEFQVKRLIHSRVMVEPEED